MDPVRTLLEQSSASLADGASLRAVEQAREALVLARGDEELEEVALDALGQALWSRGEVHHGAMVLGAADRYRRRRGVDGPPTGTAALAVAAPGWQEGWHLRPDEVVVLVDVGRTNRGRPRSGWGSLTPGERQVVELAAEGLTNPRIAQKLFLSTNTVKTHLLRAYRKLGVNSRRDLSSARR